jgi:hypothetical protein
MHCRAAASQPRLPARGHHGKLHDDDEVGRPRSAVCCALCCAVLCCAVLCALCCAVLCAVLCAFNSRTGRGPAGVCLTTALLTVLCYTTYAHVRTQALSVCSRAINQQLRTAARSGNLQTTVRASDRCTCAERLSVVSVNCVLSVCSVCV